MLPQWIVLMSDFSHQYTPTLKKKTHSHTDRHLVSPTHAGSPFLPPHFLLFPLPCQHKPVMWLSQIMRWEFYCSSLWAWHQSVRMTATSGLSACFLVLSALCWLLWAHTGYTDCSLRSSSNALQSGRSRVDLRMTSREWQCLSQPTSTVTCQSQRHKGMQAAPALLCSVEEVLIQEWDIHTGRRQCSICILYKYWWAEAMWGTEDPQDRVATDSWWCPVWLLKHLLIRYSMSPHHTAYL